MATKITKATKPKAGTFAVVAVFAVNPDWNPIPFTAKHARNAKT